jgi:hypothetical protein
MLGCYTIKQQNTLDKDKKEMHYTRLIKRDKNTSYDLTKEISDRSTLCRADTYAVLVSSEEVIPRMLSNGRIVS